MDDALRAHDPNALDFSALYLRTREILREHLRERQAEVARALPFLTERAVPHVELMREGMRWILRSSDGGVDELRYVVGPDIGADDPLDSRAPRALRPADVQAALALLHARVVMGWLPSLPREATTYPGPPSYRDIAPPHGPAELKDRVEELERGLWEVATGRPRDSIEHARYRRLYAYFEAGAWISVQQSRRLRGRS